DFKHKWRISDLSFIMKRMSQESLPLNSPHSDEVITADEATAFLAELGISVAGIQDALLDAVDAASMRDDPYWANTARGIELWSSLVHGVRELLHIDGSWIVDNPHNRPILIRDGGNYEFALAGGDSGTGIAEDKPGFSRKPGRATINSANRFSHAEASTLISLLTTIIAINHPHLRHHLYATGILHD